MSSTRVSADGSTNGWASYGAPMDAGKQGTKPDQAPETAG